jgi:hypothetical protein
MPYDPKRVISLPVYFNSSREKIVTKLDMPCNSEDQQIWTQMAVAIYIQSII